ncbi:isochorismatase family protein [Achromobacter xylosoxidans]
MQVLPRIAVFRVPCLGKENGRISQERYAFGAGFSLRSAGLGAVEVAATLDGRSHSYYRPGQPRHEFKPETAPIGGEPVIPKQTNSAFIGTDLEQKLRNNGLDALVVAGVITNNSVEATVRMAGNLGFQVWLVADGCFTFARTDWNGSARSAEDVHAMSLANLDGEYCTVVTADALLSALG